MTEETWDRIFSSDNMIDYAMACDHLADEIPQHFVHEGADTLVIPSRGAVPFFLGMIYSLVKADKKLAELQSAGTAPNDPRIVKRAEQKMFYDNLAVQETLLPLLPAGSSINGDVHNKSYRVLLVPFTADLNIAQACPGEDNEEFVTKTRQYWANFTAAMFKSPKLEDRIGQFRSTSMRRVDPYFTSFTELILKGLESRLDAARIYEEFPEIKRFAIIDTVISGRASNEILRAFDELADRHSNPNLRPTAFLVVSEDGQKLKKHKHFNQYLKQKKDEGSVNMVEIPRIVSEDKNASLLGVGAVVYPTVMRESLKLQLAGREFFVGAGSWRLNSELGEGNPHIENFRTFMSLVYAGIDYLSTAGDASEAGRAFEERRREVVRVMETSMKISGSKAVDYVSRVYKGHVEKPYESGSSVFHLPLSAMTNQKMFLGLKALPGIHHKETQIINLRKRKK